MKHLWKTLLYPVGVVLIAASAWAAANEMSIQVKKAVLRDKPSFLGRPAAYAVYGDRVRVADRQGDWVHVETPAGAAGWVHASAVTAKRIVLKAGAADAPSSASADELALAGKGFNADVEAEFKAANRDVDYRWVDTMEGMNFSPNELSRFLRQGGVAPAGPGQRRRAQGGAQ